MTSAYKQLSEYTGGHLRAVRLLSSTVARILDDPPNAEDKQFLIDAIINQWKEEDESNGQPVRS